MSLNVLGNQDNLRLRSAIGLRRMQEAKASNQWIHGANGEVEEEKKSARTQQIRELLRGLERQDEKNGMNAFGMAQSTWMETTDSDEEEDYYKVSPNYNYKEVANKIRAAKTSQGAGQAVLAAKRKVQEVKRKIASGDGDPEELQLALTHAKRMEMAARKKKHHLELEEMVANTGKRDERMESEEKAMDELRQSMVAAEEEKITEQEDAIFDERQKMIHEAVEAAKERQEEVSDEAFAQVNEIISEYGEEELKRLEEAMELFEAMEVVDPHMSTEEFEKLKQKHRASEEKAMVKADMDYLKDLMALHTVALPELSAGGIDVQV